MNLRHCQAPQHWGKWSYAWTKTLKYHRHLHRQAQQQPDASNLKAGPILRSPPFLFRSNRIYKRKMEWKWSKSRSNAEIRIWAGIKETLNRKEWEFDRSTLPANDARGGGETREKFQLSNVCVCTAIGPFWTSGANERGWVWGVRWCDEINSSRTRKLPPKETNMRLQANSASTPTLKKHAK